MRCMIRVILTSGGLEFRIARYGVCRPADQPFVEAVGAGGHRLLAADCAAVTLPGAPSQRRGVAAPLSSAAAVVTSARAMKVGVCIFTCGSGLILWELRYSLCTERVSKSETHHEQAWYHSEAPATELGKIVDLLLFLFFPSQHAVSRNDNDHRHGRGTLSPRPPRPCRQMGELRVSDRTPPTRSPACSTPPNKKGFADEGFLGAGG